MTNQNDQHLHYIDLMYVSDVHDIYIYKIYTVIFSWGFARILILILFSVICTSRILSTYFDELSINLFPFLIEFLVNFSPGDNMLIMNQPWQVKRQ